MAQYYVETNKHGCQGILDAAAGFIDIQKGCLEDQLDNVKGSIETRNVAKVAEYGAEAHKYQQQITRMENVLVVVRNQMSRMEALNKFDTTIHFEHEIVLDLIMALEVYTDQVAAELYKPVPCEEEMAANETVALTWEQVQKINNEVESSTLRLAATERALGELRGMYRLLSND